MAAARPALAFVSLILIAGGCLLILLTLLGGSVNNSPVNKFYFLEADTGGIGSAAPQTRWTLWAACTVDATGKNTCPGAKPAYPFDPPRNFGTTQNVPTQFVGTHKYYYLTRFMFAFILIGLFFGVCALFLSLLALCSRIGSFLTSALISVALFFQTLTACLMTAAFVLGRKNFRSEGRIANLGKYNFGFMWAAVACWFISMVLLCAGGVAGGSSSSSSGRKSRFGRFGRKKSTRSRRSRRSRGSFIDGKSNGDV